MGLLFRRERTANSHEARCGIARRNAGERFEQQVEALAGNRAAHVQHVDVRRRGRKEIRGDPVVLRGYVGYLRRVRREDDACGLSESKRSYLVSCGPGRAYDQSGASKARREAQHQEARQASLYGLARQEATKGVRVVARDDRMTCGQSQREMGVAMVDDVKHITLAREAQECPAVQPEPIENSIRGTACPVGAPPDVADDRQEGWAHQARRHRLRVLPG